MILLKLLISSLLITMVQSRSCTTVEQCQVENSEKCYDDMQTLCPYDQEYWNFSLIWGDSNFPPLTADIETDQEMCKKRMECVSKLHCNENKSLKEIRPWICFPTTSRIYKFESYCFFNILFETHRKDVECAKNYDFKMKNGIMNKDVYMDGKPCLLEMAENSCTPKYLPFLKENYDELVNIYFKKPENDYCDSFYDKLYYQTCEKMRIELSAKLRRIMFLDASNKDFESALRDIKDIQKCTHQSCLSNEYKNNEINAEVDAVKNFPSDSTETLKNHPYLRNFQCLKYRPLIHILDMYEECVNGKEEEETNCVLAAIAHYCQNEIVEKFAKNGFKGID